MSEQYKKIAFLAPKPGMSESAFCKYWRETHGPVVSGSPGYNMWRLRYVQNHVVGDGPIGGAFAFSGMAEFWLPGNSPNEDAFSTSDIYQDRIRMDEMNFIDVDQTISMSAVENVVKAGSSNIKLVILSRRRPHFSAENFRQLFAENYVKALLAEFGAEIRGWSVNHVLDGTYRLPGGRRAIALAVDCVEEFWFDSPDKLAMVAQMIKRQTSTLFAAGIGSSFLAKEYMFYDDGRPVTPG